MNGYYLSMLIDGEHSNFLELLLQYKTRKITIDDFTTKIRTSLQEFAMTIIKEENNENNNICY